MDKEKLIYEIFKDTALKSNWFRYILIDRFKLNDKQIANIYARINNYQTKNMVEKLEITNKFNKE